MYPNLLWCFNNNSMYHNRCIYNNQTTRDSSLNLQKWDFSQKTIVIWVGIIHLLCIHRTQPRILIKWHNLTLHKFNTSSSRFKLLLLNKIFIKMYLYYWFKIILMYYLNLNHLILFLNFHHNPMRIMKIILSVMILII